MSIRLVHLPNQYYQGKFCLLEEKRIWVKGKYENSFHQFILLQSPDVFCFLKFSSFLVIKLSVCMIPFLIFVTPSDFFSALSMTLPIF